MKVDAPSLATSSFRACRPGETFDKVSPFLSRLGITRVAAQTGLDCIGLPVWCAYTPNARSIVIAQGKGLTDEAARTSAVMEAVERAVAGAPGRQTVTATPTALIAAGENVDALEGLLAMHASPIAAKEEVEWARAKNLVSGETIHLPFAAAHFDRTVLSPRFWLSSDGLASGNTRAEAELHGLLERIERDALTLWQISSPASRYGRRLRIGAGDAPELVEVLRRIEAADLEMALFDMTTDLGVACVAALLGPSEKTRQRDALRHVDVTLGAGASVSPQVAALRAMTEAVQSRMTFIGGARDDLVAATYTAPLLPQTLAAFGAPAHCTLDAMQSIPADAAEDALAAVAAALRKRNVTRLYAVDLTPPWLPVHVTKVFAPQLENPDGDRRRRLGARAYARMLH